MKTIKKIKQCKKQSRSVKHCSSRSDEVLKGSPFLASWRAAREFLERQGIPDASRHVQTLLDSAEVLSTSFKPQRGENLPLPIIFKAAFGGGGRGMRSLVQTSPDSDSPVKFLITAA